MSDTATNDDPILEGKVCIVAGAGNGLGKHAAAHLAERGAQLVVNDLGTSVSGEGSDPSVAEAVVDDIKAQGGTAIAYHGDASDSEVVEELLDTTLDEFGRLDGIANFAGIIRDGWLTNLSDEDWDRVIRVNVRSNFALLRTAARHWRSLEEDERHPQRAFLGVSSMGALGNIGQLNYATAKAGVLGFVRAASTELYESGVRVNGIIPSGFTRMTETVPEEHRPYTRAEMPPERVAPMVAYLLSDAAEDVTGCTLYAGGDRIGLFSDPRMERAAVSPGGWTAEDIAAEMDGQLTDGIPLTRTDRFL